MEYSKLITLPITSLKIGKLYGFQNPSIFFLELSRIMTISIVQISRPKLVRTLSKNIWNNMLIKYIHLKYKRRAFWNFTLHQSNTFVGSSPSQGNILFLKSVLKWTFSYTYTFSIMYFNMFSRILNTQIYNYSCFFIGMQNVFLVYFYLNWKFLPRRKQ